MTPSPWCVKDTFGALRIIIKARRESIRIHFLVKRSNPSDGRRELENCWRIDLFSFTIIGGTCWRKFPMKRIIFLFPVLKRFEKRKRRLLKFLCPIFVIYLFLLSFFSLHTPSCHDSKGTHFDTAGSAVPLVAAWLPGLRATRSFFLRLEKVIRWYKMHIMKVRDWNQGFSLLNCQRAELNVSIMKSHRTSRIWEKIRNHEVEHPDSLQSSMPIPVTMSPIVCRSFSNRQVSPLLLHEFHETRWLLLLFFNMFPNTFLGPPFLKDTTNKQTKH